MKSLNKSQFYLTTTFFTAKAPFDLTTCTVYKPGTASICKEILSDLLASRRTFPLASSVDTGS